MDSKSFGNMLSIKLNTLVDKIYTSDAERSILRSEIATNIDQLINEDTLKELKKKTECRFTARMQSTAKRLRLSIQKMQDELQSVEENISQKLLSDVDDEVLSQASESASTTNTQQIPEQDSQNMFREDGDQDM